MQITSDGVHFEHSTCYHRYTVESYQHFLLLAARTGIAVPADVRSRLQRMVDFLLAMRRPDGSMPEVGDADGGRLLPLVRRAPDDFARRVCHCRGDVRSGRLRRGRGRANAGSPLAPRSRRRQAFDRCRAFTRSVAHPGCLRMAAMP